MTHNLLYRKFVVYGELTTHVGITETTCSKVGAKTGEMATDSDDEAPQLSAHSLAALREFYDEREERQRLFEASFATGAGGEGGVAIEEDWVRIVMININPCV